MDDLRWFHAQLWLYGHWLPGSDRGFRSTGHRIHCSGDYQQRPPRGEHAGMHRHAKSLLTQQPITLTMHQRQLVGERLIRWFDIKAIPMVAVSVGGAHAHLLCQLPDHERDATIGNAKRYASTEARRADPALPSKLFARKGEPKPVRDFTHFKKAFDYVVNKHRREGAWTRGIDVALLLEYWRL